MECGSPDWLPSLISPETLSSEPVEALLPTLSLSGAIPGITGKPIRMLERLWRGRGSSEARRGGCSSFAHLQTQDLRYQPLGGKGTSLGPRVGGSKEAGQVVTYLWGGLADQRRCLYLVGHDLGHPEELIEALEEDCAPHLSPRCHQVCAGLDRGLWGGVYHPPALHPSEWVASAHLRALGLSFSASKIGRGGAVGICGTHPEIP